MAGFFSKLIDPLLTPRANLSLAVVVFALGAGLSAVFSGDGEVAALNSPATSQTAALSAEAPTAGARQEAAGPATRAEQEARATLLKKASREQKRTRESGSAAQAGVKSASALVSLMAPKTPAETKGQDALQLANAAPSALWSLEGIEASRSSLALPGAGAAVLASLEPASGPDRADQTTIDAIVEATINGHRRAAPEPASPSYLSAEEERLAWRRNAAAPSARRDWPKIAIVIDDLGNNRTRFRHVAALPGKLTLSFLTYALAIEELAVEARAAGHEVMLHVPMEPQGTKPAVPDLLSADLSPAELDRRIGTALSRLSLAAGINNHMGSRFTQDREKMRRVLSAVRSKGLFFLDSRTSPNSVGLSVARELGIPSIGRDVFLDHEIDGRFIRGQLQQVERVAREQGYAVAIGHPHAATIEALRDWLPTLAGKELTVTPLSDIIASLQRETLVASARDD